MVGMKCGQCGSSRRTVELHRALRATLEPTLEADDEESPAEGQASDSDTDIEEHHDVVAALAHRRNREFLGREHKLEATTCEEEGRKRFSRRAGREYGAGRTEPQEEVCQAAHDGEAREQVAPQHVNLYLEEVRLEVRAHGGASDTDAEGGEGIEARDVAWRLSDGLLRAVTSRNCRRCTGREPTPDAFRLDAHANQTSEPKHDRNTDMLHLLCRVGIAGVCAETFHPSVRDAVEEDDEGFDKLGCRVCTVVPRGSVPSPAELGEGSQEPGKCYKAVAPENATLCVVAQLAHGNSMDYCRTH